MSINYNEKRILIRYLAVSAFCLLFSTVYGVFSHGIHSPWMSFLAAWPLVLGAVPAAGRLMINRRSGKKMPGTCVWTDIYRFGIAALTAASLLKGILEIAGTDSGYPGLLLCAGAAMLVIGAAGTIRHRCGYKGDHPLT